MSLAPGIRLGAYDIVAPLGAGGMGEVYRAHDSRLKRDVAIKVLPLEYSRNPDRVRRFEQEARAAAALNHPNILTVFDIGTHENTQYIVEELIDGETLRARLERGPLPWRQAVDIAAAIADGLAAAHSKGIFHRDIKPANVILTDDGRIKLLDFGVAKLKEDMESGVPDGTATDTASGTLVGTTAYMSPEQVAARPVDARTDLFSLGTVLYEMVDGRNPFARSTTPEMMAAILKDEPPALLAAPTALRRVLAQCLHKNPEARVQSARDLGLILRTLVDLESAMYLLRPSPQTAPTWSLVVLCRCRRCCHCELDSDCTTDVSRGFAGCRSLIAAPTGECTLLFQHRRVHGCVTRWTTYCVRSVGRWC